jgi:pantoate--beta-alanine ligase
VRLVFGETIRETDGLAMSSRNSYLSPDQRAVAPVLHRALRAGERELASQNVEWVEQAMRDAAKGMEIDYLVLVDPETFERPASFDRDLLLAGAIRIGKTRLIDNVRVPRRR